MASDERCDWCGAYALCWCHGEDFICAECWAEHWEKVRGLYGPEDGPFDDWREGDHGQETETWKEGA